MRYTNLDIDVLRSFVTGMELGSFSKAAERLAKSASAVSAQLRKLEEQLGEPVLRKSGRGLALTEAGETMLAYARRILEVNDEAVLAVRARELDGCVRLGTQEDFGEGLLPQVLAAFAKAHPKVKVEARVARNAELLEKVTNGVLDLALVWEVGSPLRFSQRIADVPMCWIGPFGMCQEWMADRSKPLPLAVFDMPCYFRTAGTEALDNAGIPWRHAFSSPNLGALWAATSAGLGLTVRSQVGLPKSVRALVPSEAGLPVLPSLGLALQQAEQTLSRPASRLAAIVSQAAREAVSLVPGAVVASARTVEAVAA